MSKRSKLEWADSDTRYRVPPSLEPSVQLSLHWAQASTKAYYVTHLPLRQILQCTFEASILTTKGSQLKDND